MHDEIGVRAEALEQAAQFVEKNTPYLQGVGSVGVPMAEHIRKMGGDPNWLARQIAAPLEEARHKITTAIEAHNVCADELATFLEGLRELSAAWPHDFTKLRGPHDGAEKAKCKRCQIEKRLGERVTGGGEK